ncbi:MAG: UDP-N-acetylglucosamine--N-acetylmuramyl-(pentapeptide) pyrophosphoryl-undecaprenol N-acetylglucosamine transferase [Candidatus Peregrinibacteria bacterium Greene0416_62]|nr:MAG: UDP-N-acetylglucosamine--N-acetylmuramyl-(pentapeptide) pyrophosphoryl-undecaprenol N-acetylglucosamine transferase [Candidatus Peregrinibacteria bacterium Greene0416_62]TSD00283.1 MAG: UDP-N-acetylglucosamine--N-acetylmuramyl-(pentapeptide) pyrophosphoryl-undecaprenol N-acetylglucosamine transferase [Candidatus Peregrinibacteria bacterium Greene1014_49]
MSTILFAGGGTLGHIIPAVAVARELMKQHPEVVVHFICSPRGEASFLEKEQLPYTILNAPRISWNFPWKFFRAYQRSHALLRSLNPSLIFSKGGYVAVPICLAAYRMKIPIILHESDAVMGRANRMIARIATHVCLGFPTTSNSRLTTHDFTGNPLRKEITNGTRAEGLRLTGFSGTRPILLIMGGSQGAQTINEWVDLNLQELISLCDIIHLTGYGKIANHQSQIANRHYFHLPFAHEEFPHLYAIADVAISRAGASSIAELAGNAIPSILIPLLGVAHDHQYWNAVSVQRRGAALLVTQDDMDKELINVLKQLIHDPAAREILRAKIREFCIGDSTGQIVKIISRTLAEKQGA